MAPCRVLEQAQQLLFLGKGSLLLLVKYFTLQLLLFLPFVCSSSPKWVVGLAGRILVSLIALGIVNLCGGAVVKRGGKAYDVDTRRGSLALVICSPSHF